jgi:hypothetical protein
MTKIDMSVPEQLHITPSQYMDILALANRCNVEAHTEALMRFGGLHLLSWPPVYKWSEEIENRYLQGITEILGRDIVPRDYELVLIDE